MAAVASVAYVWTPASPGRPVGPPGRDAYLSAEDAARFHELRPDARAQVIDQCCHSAHEDCPDEVNTALLDFLT